MTTFITTNPPPSVKYYPEQDFYLNQHTGETYTEDQMVYFDELESEWWDSQRQPSFFQLVKHFGPPCYRPAVVSIKLKITQAQETIKHIKITVADLYQHIVNPAPYEQQKDLTEVIHGLYDHRLTEAERVIRKNKYRLGYLHRLLSRHLAVKRGEALTPEDPRRITEADIEQAKAVPLEDLIKVNQAGFASCFLHIDKTSSLKVYKKQNHWHCFSCDTGRDSIDLVMKQQNVEFIEAVRILINKK